MLKYGRFALADELSGTPGQVTPDRSYEELVAGRLGPLVASDPVRRAGPRWRAAGHAGRRPVGRNSPASAPARRARATAGDARAAAGRA